ncbi:hypothetical protein B0H63DRAFT_507074 [Podospora didyma]|uniref:Rad60/SUMO-like domain-containing protein n=1 Tax=Podospora didyma TaxID=330526 RepID=A0AAE0U3P8_9PEZI|nr:hypothetical protein B0H63DRAFT_507074 [Podospora didyma]
MTMTDSSPAEPPKKKKALPFKRTVPRQQPLTDSSANAAEESGNDLDFFRRSHDVLPLPALEEARLLSDDEFKGPLDVASDRRDCKRRKVSLENDAPNEAQKGTSVALSSGGSPVPTKHMSPLVIDLDDIPIVDVKGKGKAIARPPNNLSPRETLVSIKSSMTATVLVDDDDNGGTPLSTPVRQRTRELRSSPRKNRVKRGSSPLHSIDDSEVVRSDPEEENGDQDLDGLGEAEPSADFSKWIAKAQEMESQNQDAVINIMMNSVVPGTKPLCARRKLRGDMNVVLLSWVDHQRTAAKMTISDDEVDTLVLTWKGNKIYRHSTAASLGVELNSNGELKAGGLGEGYYAGGLFLQVWTPEAYQDFVQEKERDRALALGMADEDDPTAPNQQNDDEPAPEEKQVKIRIVLIAKALPPLKTTVFEDTTMGTILAAFRKQRNIGSDREVAIYFDGEKLLEDALVRSADIDPDDINQFEVHLK